jgi:RHS repeat-associated protein
MGLVFKTPSRELVVSGYDLEGRLISQTLGNGTRQLSYDANGNITGITGPMANQAYSYDALSRLSAANGDEFELAWQYDANGNRLYQSDAGTGTAYTLDSSSNRLLAVDATDYRYDANGNLIHDGEHSYRYNARNRLSAVDDGATAEYRYNALGQRVYKKAVGDPCDVNNDGVIDRADLHQVNGKNGVTVDADGPGKGQAKGKGQQVACVATRIGRDANNGRGKGLEKKLQSGNSQWLFAYDEHRLLGEYGPRGSVRQETIWLGNLPVATIQNGNTYYIHADHLGTPRVITDSDNTEVWRWDSDPFGTTAANEDPDGDGKLFVYNLRFPGQYYDSETGLHYNYFRDYDPSTGRYIESDPIGLNGGKNTYNYVFSRPLTLTDMLGLSSDETCEPVVIKYYADVDHVLVQPELGYLSDPVCYPAPMPSGGMPDPTSSRKRSSFPSPLDISFELRCVREWVKTQEEKWDIEITMMVQYYLKCKNECTGEERNIGPTKRPLEEFEKVKDLY